MFKHQNRIEKKEKNRIWIFVFKIIELAPSM